MFEESINFHKLNEISNLLRYRTVKTSHEASIPHLGSCLSCVEILVYLYWIELNLDPLYLIVRSFASNNPFTFLFKNLVFFLSTIFGLF